MDWDNLRFALALSRDGSLTAAATSLGVTHTTVGRRLRTMEDTLGVRLFDRTPEGFMVTPAGHDLVSVAEGMEAKLLAMESRVLGRDAELSGALRVSTMDMLFRCYHSVFSSFTERYPSVKLTVSSSDTAVSLLRREADVALRLTNSPPEYLVGRKLTRLDFAVYGQTELVQSIGADAGYDAFPWLSWDERLDMGWLDAWLATNAPAARVALRLDFSSLGLREAVIAGLGIHFLARVDGDSDPRLTQIGPTHPEFGRDVWVLTLAELRSSHRIRVFMDHVANAISPK
ncbi:MAG: DNA-binding transcriptional LysR family regulator [Myxococcota bacterium]|jgi:DNA-binding transcriptional LysR family regulator